MLQLQNTKLIQPPTHQFPHQNPHHIPQLHHINTSLSPPLLKLSLSRRDLAIFTNSSLLLLFTSQAKAEETPLQKPPEKAPTKRAFLDISIDGKPAGRITIALDEENAPFGAGRFSDLVSGRAGISFRRKEFVKIMPNYVQHGGIRSYGVDAEIAKRTAGRDLRSERLVEEWERLNDNNNNSETKNVAGSVSIIVRDPTKPPPKVKLVARKGKLEIDEEEVGVEPNGTEFAIAMRDSPELDSSAVVVGRVVEGMDVVERIGMVKTVQENTSSPYFRVAKLIGDKRAVVAERGFNRPYSKVTVMNCGLLD